MGIGQWILDRMLPERVAQLEQNIQALMRAMETLDDRMLELETEMRRHQEYGPHEEGD